MELKYIVFRFLNLYNQQNFTFYNRDLKISYPYIKRKSCMRMQFLYVINIYTQNSTKNRKTTTLNKKGLFAISQILRILYKDISFRQLNRSLVVFFGISKITWTL